MYSVLQIHQEIPEMESFAYFRWILNGWSIQFYRERTGLFQFHINLPLIHIDNTSLRSQVSGKSGKRKVVAVTTGKILRWELGKN